MTHRTSDGRLDRHISSGWHHTFGWLRRPELDLVNAGFVYEMPDGTLVVSKEARHRDGLYLDAWEDAKTGELYTACSCVPRVYPSASTFNIKHALKNGIIERGPDA